MRRLVDARGRLSSKEVSDNRECADLLRILGIELGTAFTEERVRKLPYGRLMVLSDQDVDGTHIAALLCNLVHVCAPALLRLRPDFVCRFATSLSRVALPAGRGGRAVEEVGFYTAAA